MKIAIITLHNPMNCGSALQGYALNYYMNHVLKMDSFIIDYCPPYIEDSGYPLRNFVRKYLFWFSYRKRRQNFDEFILKHDCLSEKRYRSFTELKTDPPLADLYVVGSDQLWNPCFSCGNDDTFFLKFVEGTRKISYATSLGTSKYTKNQLIEIAKKLNDFEYISVREQCSIPQLFSAGIKNAKCVCDPTLLLSSNHYNEIATDYKNLGKYVAVYLVERSELLEYVLSHFKEKGYKIVGVGGFLKKFPCDVHYKDVGPKEFLGLIRDASYVVATSFHACIFSLIFQKEFFIIPPKMNPERIEEILKITDLSERIIECQNNFDAIKNQIDYEAVQRKLDCFIDYSKKELIRAIKGRDKNNATV